MSGCDYDHEALKRVWKALGVDSYTGKSVDEHVAALHSRAEVYQKVLSAIIRRGHSQDCTGLNSRHRKPCDCHVAIAEEAVKGEVNG